MWNKKYLISLGLITAVILIIGGLLWNSGTMDLSTDETAISVAPWIRGPKEAPVTVDMYPDFECSICVDKERMALRVFDNFSGNIRLVYHHYADAGFSEKMAEALEAAGDQGKFWEMHDRIIEKVPSDITQLKAVAEDIGLDITQFNNTLESDRYTGKVRLAKQEAISAGVKYVSVFINGKEYRGNPGTLDDFRAAINEELEKMGANNGN
ncbi:DsbA family protein [Chloroflexota bacterium]